MLANPLSRARVCLAIVIAGLLLSGVTAFPIETELTWGCHLLGIPPGSGGWLDRVRAALVATNDAYPFLAYGTDWLAFAHLILAVLFVGPYHDPARNIWVIDFGLVACVGVLVLAWTAGPARGIPVGWRWVDSSFGLLAAVPLLVARRAARQLSAAERAGTVAA